MGSQLFFSNNQCLVFCALNLFHSSVTKQLKSQCNDVFNITFYFIIRLDEKLQILLEV